VPPLGRDGFPHFCREAPTYAMRILRGKGEIPSPLPPKGAKALDPRGVAASPRVGALLPGPAQRRTTPAPKGARARLACGVDSRTSGDGSASPPPDVRSALWAIRLGGPPVRAPRRRRSYGSSTGVTGSQVKRPGSSPCSTAIAEKEPASVEITTVPSTSSSPRSNSSSMCSAIRPSGGISR
jgi:hypothetical protein